ncbi:flagellar biosynthetic protein FliR [Nitrosomonas sp.]|uniref:flagellar biosynthetic protein FliR n=1 Tax=Nitrosomonas sp. TaxID=42353 RepID=UPI0025D1B77E|nr:flagellar biosynthetic protein FliR [Nitrosomonas sp.]MCC6916755.1 flagellar biosynthetic protein FliR [Nitrosomonas sp.]
MISITTEQLNGWLAVLIWPLVRILAILASTPLLGSSSIPTPVKLGLALLLAILIAPLLPPLPQIDPGSGIGLIVLMQQVIIGLAMGFSMRIIFTAIEMAGEITGLQMGLGFAMFFDPQQSGQVQVIGRFYGLLATLFFLAIDGHLQVITILAESFTTLPVGTDGINTASFTALVDRGVMIFTLGLHLALPVLTALLITNLALGILTRAAPQLNIFAVGFPLTLGIGLLVMSWVLPYCTPLFSQIFRESFSFMQSLAGGAVHWTGIP